MTRCASGAGKSLFPKIIPYPRTFYRSTCAPRKTFENPSRCLRTHTDTHLHTDTHTNTNVHATPTHVTPHTRARARAYPSYTCRVHRHRPTTVKTFPSAGKTGAEKPLCARRAKLPYSTMVVGRTPNKAGKTPRALCREIFHSVHFGIFPINRAES